MGIHLELLDLNAIYNNTSKIPIFINDIQETSEEDKSNINSLIYTKYNGDLLSNLPSCECGELMGVLNIGITCENCRTEVTSDLDNILEPILWIRAPAGVAALMNPSAWAMISNHFMINDFSVIRWLCDTTYRVEAIQDIEIPRGWNYFVNNFDDIMTKLFEMKRFKLKRESSESLKEMIRMYRHCIFTNYLPLPNKSLLVIEETNVGTYINPDITGAVDAIRTMIGIDAPTNNFTIRMKENRVVKTTDQLSEFYQQTIKNTLAKKEGIFRKHIFGTRSHFSFRCVISSLTEPHRYDEIHISWGIGVAVFELHLINKLLRIGYTPNEAKAFLNEHAQKYNPVLDDLFKELINEADGGRGISTSMQRNPSLERGSVQSVFITKVKTDTSIPTVSMSILTVRGLNADYDGDQLNFTLSIDNKIANGIEALAPHKSVFDLNSPRMVADNLSMAKTVISTLSKWYHAVEPDDPVKLQKMEQLYID